MSDLISREYLLNHAEYDGNGRLVIPYKTVENAPTAFDKEKVINELREELNLSDAEKERCARKIHFNLILQKRLCEWNSKCD